MGNQSFHMGIGNLSRAATFILECLKFERCMRNLSQMQGLLHFL